MNKLFCLLGFALVGCTVVPDQVSAPLPQLNGNVANGGLLGFLPDGSAWIASSARLRYDTLIKEGYNRLFTPAIPPDYELTLVPAGTLAMLQQKSDAPFVLTPAPAGTYAIEAEALVDFGVMAGQKRANQPPPK